MQEKNIGGGLSLILDSENQSLAEDKILILYVLKKVGKPLSYKELMELIIAVADINYFYFQQFLSDLLEDNFISKRERRNRII